MRTAETARWLAGRLVQVISNLLDPSLADSHRRVVVIFGRTDPDELLIRLVRANPNDECFELTVTSTVVVLEFVNTLRTVLSLLFRSDKRIGVTYVEVGDIVGQFRTVTKVIIHE